MTITSSVSADGKELTISIAGYFDFNVHEDFRGCYENLPHNPERYLVDMREATYLDSSALGMLLLLREYAGGNGARIRIINCKPQVKKLLDISRMERLFSIQ